MRNRLPRQPRTVVSVHMPLTDYVRSSRAAGMSGDSLAEFIREATRRRTVEVLGEEPPQDLAA